MEQNRVVLSSEEIAEEIKKLRRESKFSEETYTLVESDFKYGLNKEEVNVYLNKKFGLKQMKFLSKTIKEHGVDVGKAIAEYAKDSYCMNEAAVYFAKDVPVEILAEAMQETDNAYNLKCRLVAYLDEKAREAEKENQDNSHLEEELLRLQEELAAEKKKVAKGNEAISKLRNDVEEKNGELEKLSKRLEDAQKTADEEKVKREQLEQEMLQKEQREKETLEKAPETSPEKQKPNNSKEEEVSIMEEENKRPAIPVHYAVAFPYGTTVIEKEERKSSGMAALVSKLGFKKKSYQDVVRLAINGKLKADQLTQLKTAITFGLTEKQMQDLINSNLPAAEMKEIIEIAVLVNEL